MTLGKENSNKGSVIGFTISHSLDVRERGRTGWLSGTKYLTAREMRKEHE